MKIPFGEQCRYPLCKQRGTHTNHRYKDCRFKNGQQQSLKRPNLGKAPTKSKDSKSKRDLSLQARPFPTATANNDRRCYICNDLNHLSPSCPQKDKNKKHAQSKLKANRSFMALFQASFPKSETKECAQRMIDA